MPENKKPLFAFFKPLSTLIQKNFVYVVNTLKTG